MLIQGGVLIKFSSLHDGSLDEVGANSRLGP